MYNEKEWAEDQALGIGAFILNSSELALCQLRLIV